jgi:hypothetical protein
MPINGTVHNLSNDLRAVQIQEFVKWKDSLYRRRLGTFNRVVYVICSRAAWDACNEGSGQKYGEYRVWHPEGRYNYFIGLLKPL